MRVRGQSGEARSFDLFPVLRRSRAPERDREHAAAPGMAEAALRTVPERPRAGARTELAFTLADASGQPIQELMTHHARKLHVLIVSDDMQVLGHIHPHESREPIKDGEAKVFFTFRAPAVIWLPLIS
jgi:hypothetical protein